MPDATARHWERYLEGGYYALLPYFAYVSIFMLGQRAGITILLGWVVVLVYQILFLGLFHAEVTPFRPAARFLFALPPLLIGGKQLIAQGTVWNFFLEEMLLEALALMLVFIGQLFFTRDRFGTTAWEEMGITPLLIAAILVGGMWDFGKTWWAVNMATRRPDWFGLIILTAALGFAVFNYWRAISAVRTGRLVIADVFENKFGLALILGQIVLWVALGGLLAGIVGAGL